MREIQRQLKESDIRRLERKLIKKEQIRPPEVYRPKFAVLAISGPSGTGKTAIATRLAEMYGIPMDEHNPDDMEKNRVIKVGEKMRKLLAKKGKMLGFVQREEAIDKRIDNWQANLIRKTTIDSPIILEGRVAGIIHSEERAKMLKHRVASKRQILPVVPILLYAKQEVRFKRIQEREIKAVLKKLREEVGEELTPEEAVELYPDRFKNLSLDVITAKTREREKGDLKRWRKMHPQIGLEGPFSPGIKDKEGRNIYDLNVSTSNRTVDEVVDYIHQSLVEKGWVVRADSQNKNNGNGSYKN